jgi:prepilin-type N-terminal cleavage/methylation domain-containing protein
VPSRRPAYTLLELVLVMAVIAIIGAISYPSIDSMYGSYKVQGAMDSLRAGWASARVHAMEEGRPYRFAVLPGKGNFRIAPDSPEFWNGDAATSTDPNSGPLVFNGTLPKGVRMTFAGQDGEDDKDQDTVADPESTDPSQYVTAAIFLPDGTARDDVEISFQCRGTRPQALQLRAMTGLAAVKRDRGGDNR